MRRPRESAAFVFHRRDAEGLLVDGEDYRAAILRGFRVEVTRSFEIFPRVLKVLFAEREFVLRG
jgi:hypothetical protein